MKSFNEWLKLREYRTKNFQSYSRVPDSWRSSYNKNTQFDPSNVDPRDVSYWHQLKKGVKGLVPKFAGAAASELGDVFRQGMQKLGYTPTIVRPAWDAEEDGNDWYNDENWYDDEKWESSSNGVSNIFVLNTSNIQEAQKLFWDKVQKDKKIIFNLNSTNMTPENYRIIDYEIANGKTYLKVHWYKFAPPQQGIANRINLQEPKQQPNSEPLNPNVKPSI